MKIATCSDTACALGEGPLWHPGRGQLFWFDILGKRLYTVEERVERHWQFDEHVSAAGWVDETRLLVASETRLFLHDVESGRREDVCPLEADDPVTRSNDGRADPQGGFWIGSMGLEAEPGAGAIWRWYRGELRQLYDDITISNAICFPPGGETAYWVDSRDRRVMRQALDADGWPDGAAEVYLDLRGQGFNPDGAVCDADGNFWNAQWGAGRVVCYAPGGEVLSTIDLPATQATCPAFGGPDFSTLYVTTAATGIDEAQAGQTFVIETEARGQAEHRVIL